jgi:hypothetical protein
MHDDIKLVDMHVDRTAVRPERVARADGRRPVRSGPVLPGCLFVCVGVCVVRVVFVCLCVFVCVCRLVVRKADHHRSMHPLVKWFEGKRVEHRPPERVNRPTPYAQA